ncbi:hypothetical protein CVT24_013034 [Panaeolus cyanescens]|uniref:G-protein coupled receptors family 1 profile domain-containing protein n=1 Tax=Panaeolus cyanescens TaxID=181874 RepID=A0A409YUL8_9AGAR|nr:hypothetical protein CVT24_013034 [Panaeolus cyanescens]
MSGTLDNSTSWQPIDETPLDVLNDAVNLIASTTINGVAYGVVLTLYLVCVYALIQQFRAGIRKNQAIWSGVYITIMFALGTVYCAVNSRITQLAYVNFRNFPGGPAAFAVFVFSTPINIAGAAAFFITSWMNDALLVWRLWVLYRGSRYATLITGFALIMYLGTFSMGMVTLIESVLPTQSFWSAIAIKFALAYYALTTSYTIVITGLMIARILMVRRAFIKATGRREYGTQYLSIAAMLIESSALYTIWGIIFLGLYIVNHPVQFVFLASLSEVQIIAPLLIIYRVSIGKAWQSDTTQTLTAGGQSQSRTAVRSNGITSGTATDRTYNNIHVVVDRNVTHDESSLHKEHYELA